VQTSAPAPSLTPAGSPAAAPDLPTVEEVRSSVTDVKIDLVADRVLAWVAFELYGKALSLELEGRLRTVDGHLWLEPSRGKLGSLPLPEATLQSAARRVFDSAENREKFRLPPEVADVRVEEGVLIVTASSRSAP
jgi:hypothetical protein